MLRIALLLAFAPCRLWGIEKEPTGELVLWIGSLNRFGCGPHASVSLDDSGVSWCVAFAPLRIDANATTDATFLWVAWVPWDE